MEIKTKFFKDPFSADISHTCTLLTEFDNLFCSTLHHILSSSTILAFLFSIIVVWFQPFVPTFAGYLKKKLLPERVVMVVEKKVKETKLNSNVCFEWAEKRLYGSHIQ